MSDPSHNKPRQGRFGPRPADPEVDFSAFKAELEASLKYFDAKSALLAEPPRPAPLPTDDPQHNFPLIDVPAETPVQTPPAPHPPGPGAPLPAPGLAEPGLDLLGELRRTAQAKAKDDNTAEGQKQMLIERAGQALRLLLRYLGEFCSHLDTIRPLVPRNFQPLPRITLTGLHWTDSFLDYRTNGGTEISPLESVSLRYTLSAGDHILIEKLPNYAYDFQEELKRFGLRYTATDKRGTRGLVEQVDFQVAREIVVSLQFKADPERQLIHLRARNFTELDAQLYILPVEAIDARWLDELGKHILGRPSRLFDSLQRS